MFRKVVFYDNYTNALTETWSSFLVQGVILILLGVAIVVMPELLVAMVATTFIALGLLSIIIAFKTKNLRKRYRSWRESLWDPF